MNVLAEKAEVEVERKRNAATFHGYDYDLVKVQGNLRIRNRMPKQVSVEVTKEVSGEIIGSSPTAKDVATAKGLKQINPKHILTWMVDVKPGEESKVQYSYQVYIRR